MRSIPFGCYKSKVGRLLLEKGILKLFSGKLSKFSFLKYPLIPAVLNRTAGIPQLSAVFLCSQSKVSFRKKKSPVSLQELPILCSEHAKWKSILSLQLEPGLPYIFTQCLLLKQHPQVCLLSPLKYKACSYLHSMCTQTDLCINCPSEGCDGHVPDKEHYFLIACFLITG